MYDICHPAYYYIEKLGCTDPVKISTTFYVYIELCEAKKYWEVNYKYVQDLDLLYLEVKRNKHSDLEIFVPWPTLYNVTLDKVEKIQDCLKTDRVTFVFKSEDSSSVMYKVSAGLVKPMNPEATKLQKEKEEKKFELEREIWKNTSYLYELAKSLKREDDKKDLEATTRDNENFSDK